MLVVLVVIPDDWWNNGFVRGRFPKEIFLDVVLALVCRDGGLATGFKGRIEHCIGTAGSRKIPGAIGMHPRAFKRRIPKALVQHGTGLVWKLYWIHVLEHDESLAKIAIVIICRGDKAVAGVGISISSGVLCSILLCIRRWSCCEEKQKHNAW